MTTEPNRQLALDRLAIQRRLTRLRNRLVRLARIDGLARAILAATLILLFSLALDYSLDRWTLPNRSVRIALSVGVVSALIACLFHWVFPRFRRPPTLASIALRLERSDSAWGDRLLVVVDHLSQANADNSGWTACLTRDVARRLERTSDHFLFQTKRVSHVALLACFAVTSVSAAACWRPAIAKTWARRVGLLADRLHYPRRTRLRPLGFESGRAVTARGRDFPFEVEADPTGVLPESVTFVIRTAGVQRSRRTITRVNIAGNADGVYRHVIKGLLEPIRVEAWGGDDHTERLLVDLVEAPVVTGLDVEIEAPSYIGTAKRRLRNPPMPIRVPQNATVQLTMTCNKTLREATLTLGGKITPMTKERFSVTGKFQVSTSQAGHFTFVDSDRFPLGSPFPIEFLAVEDLAPTVEIGRHGIGGEITPQAVAPIHFRANDDYGLSRLGWSWTLDSAPVTTETWPAPAGKSVDQITPIDFLGRALRAGQRAQLRFFAEDGKSPGRPNRTESTPLPFDIVTPEELLARLAIRELQLRQRLELANVELRGGKDELAGFASSGRPEGARPNLWKPIAAQQSQTLRKAGAELKFVGDGFREFLAICKNNRLPNLKQQEQMRENVVPTLERLSNVTIPAIDSEVSALAAANVLKDQDRHHEKALSGYTDLLRDLSTLLQSLRKLESLQQASSLLREILAEQDRLMNKTKEEQKKALRDLLK